ncbi:PREDICTED: ladinin-1 [Chrysochloris asiatica]|uniref:Ladinin-1 n=1 Tax=Chrysochloris asiatica TaxID=185453 RepID=A0A9B0WHY5_CHRAS|nr:PREDICTED: ladinin-1 [Chrysochloris asiatica]
MSVSRKDWSALSSLAKQRSVEDEEEWERERRRQHRNQSSTNNNEESPKLTQNGDGRPADRLPSLEETEARTPPSPASKNEDEDFQAILRTRRERRQRRQALEAVQSPIQERLKAEEGRDSSDPGQTKQQPLVPKKELDAPPRRRLSREQRGPWAREEESLVGREPGEGKKGAPEKTPVSEKTSVHEKTSAFEKRSISNEKTSLSEKTSEKTSVSEKIAISEKRSISEKKSVPERTNFSEKTLTPEKPSSLERKKVSEKAAIFEKTLASEKTPTTETKLTLKRAVASEQPQEQLTSEGAQPSTKEQRRRALPEKSPPPSAEPREHGESDSLTLGSRLPAFTLQVKVPSKEEEADITSPTQATYSSSLRRSSSRTISFRMSSRKDNSETTLTRSASMRLPASSVKLGEKLEKYQMAIQRSEALKSPGSTRTEFFVAPVGVSSKRHLFEKVLPSQSQAEPASSRKEHLRLSGVVTSRLNLWISRTQESGDQDPQEVQKELAATKRTSWGKKSDPPLDVELCKAPLFNQ